MATVTLHGPGFSTYTRSARLALEEKGVEYELDEINFIADGMPAEQIARHPFGKVPALTHDGSVIYEVCAIGRYVDEVFDGPALQPSDPQGRARMTQICSILDSYTYGPAISNVVIQRLVVPIMGGTPDEAVIEAAVPEVGTAMGVLNGMLGERNHLVGDAVSLADLHLVPIYDYLSKTPEGETILQSTPGLRHWWDGISGRDSVTKTSPQLG